MSFIFLWHLIRSFRILGFGVSLAIKGEYANNKTTFGVGLGLAISGLLAVIAAALGFGAAVSMINKRWVSCPFYLCLIDLRRTSACS